MAVRWMDRIAQTHVNILSMPFNTHTTDNCSTDIFWPGEARTTQLTYLADISAEITNGSSVLSK